MKVSIVVAIYNIEEYLSKCIDSIINQTHRNLEVILVDDGSIDGSGSICDCYQKKDARIRVIHKHNEGLVSARKAGISSASGEYVIALDGDDWIEKNLIEQLVLITEDKDVICTNHYIQYDTNCYLVSNKMLVGTYKCQNIINKALYYGDFYQFGITPYVWTKFVKTAIAREAVEKVDNKVSIGEDVVYLIALLKIAEDIKVTDIVGVHYVQRSSSMLRSSETDEKSRCKALINNIYNILTVKKNDELYKILNMYCKLIYSFRAINIFDNSMNDDFLEVMGGIDKKSNVVIYGAGSLGQAIYKYCSSMCGCNVVGWIDMNFQNLRNIGFPVSDPKEFEYTNPEIDYFIIGCGTRNNMYAIHKFLQSNLVEEKKIKWLTEDFLNDDYDLLSEVKEKILYE